MADVATEHGDPADLVFAEVLKLFQNTIDEYTAAFQAIMLAKQQGIQKIETSFAVAAQLLRGVHSEDDESRSADHKFHEDHAINRL